MSHLRNIAALLFLTVFSLTQLPNAHANTSDTQKITKTTLSEKESFARDFAEKVLSIIQDSAHKMADRKDNLRNAFRNSVDIDWIAKFVLGKTLSTADAKSQDDYLTAYRRYLTETYVSNFAESPEQRIRDIEVKKVYEADEEDFMVRTLMMLADGATLKVNYRVNEHNTHYRIRDFSIENVSLITTHRAELSAIATQHGIKGVIKELKKRVKQLQGEQATFAHR